MVPQRPFHNAGVTRRQILLSTGSLVAGGAAVAAMGSTPAKAAVSTTALQVPDAEYAGEDGTVASLDLEIVGNYEYDTGEATTLTLSLDVAPDDGGNGEPDYQTIDSVEESLSMPSGAGQYTLAGSLFTHPGLDAQDFNAEPEETVTRDLPIRVLMDVRNDGESVVRAASKTTATIEITNTSVDATAAVMGEGEIAIEV